VQSNRWRFLTCGFDDTERPSSQPIAFMYRRNGSAKVSSTSFRLGRNNNHRHAALLRARREWPCRSRAAHQCYECAPSHSITSSAATSRLGGMMRPRAFAVLRLMMVCRRRAQPSLTNLVRIISSEWLTWLRIGAQGIGFKKRTARTVAIRRRITAGVH
jgi:hypothetical protein